MSNPTPKRVARVLPTLLRLIPAQIRAWLYVALVVVAVGFIVVTAWRDGLSSEQLVALVLAGYGAMSRANVS